MTNNEPKTEMVAMGDTLLTAGGNPSWCHGLVVPRKTLQKEEASSGIKGSTVCIGDLSDEEKAWEIEKSTRSAWNPIWNKIVREIVDGSGNRIYVWKGVDDEGNKFFQMYQRYKDGTFSKGIRMAQADVIMAAADSVLDKRMQKKIDKFLYEVGQEYLNKFGGQTEEILKIGDVLKCLVSESPEIPVYNDDIWEIEREEFYMKIEYTIKSLILSGFEERPYIPVAQDDLEFIAETVNMNRVEFLKKLKKYDLLYLVPSSKAYQTNVRFTGPFGESCTEWRYCIKRDKELDKRIEEESNRVFNF